MKRELNLQEICVDVMCIFMEFADLPSLNLAYDIESTSVPESIITLT